MAKTSFGLYQEDMEAQFSKSSDAIKRNVKSRRDLWTLLGDIIELYVPKVVSTILGGVQLMYVPGE